MDNIFKVSVIIPVYNAAEFLGQGLDSLLNQTLHDIEIICVNDGSSDKSLEILKEYELLTLKDINCDIEVEEDKNTFEENAKKKAKEVSKLVDMPCIADDSGICIEVFNGWPGVHTARFLGENVTQEERNQAILKKMEKLSKEERKAKVECIVVYFYKGECVIGKGEITGKIAKEARGKNGFGFDSIFELDNGRTLAELSPEEKNEVSARKIALENLKKQLTNM